MTSSALAVPLLWVSLSEEVLLRRPAGDADAVGPRDALESGDEDPLRPLDFAARHRAGVGGPRRRPPRACLSLPLSGTRVSPTFPPLTPGAAGGVLAREERPPVDPVTFDPEVNL